MSLTFHAEAVIFLLMGLLFTGAALFARRNQQARQLRGRPATATVIELIPSRQLFRPKVRFVTADQRTVEAETEAAADAGQYEIGQQVEVTYDPENPENMDFAGAAPAGFRLMLLLGLLFAGLGVLQILGYVLVFEQYAH
ncbi:DUF3592 domain-containing protein [Hymenobacter busanensis]|uniref:DUF3592 domain-containing protein n=1 Tax=Hymenobacter busanensis TaxID=2607656 RepID=A0A7L4ZT94_9BACT|nr:DUF3592 domain-containing protein [Hymenobacter busanensis]KAA9327635.1 DUF3592 domain-containing protein [Hymenobacter busanensis]QHJ06025.1 DUF3592 domain-containing protein [Hymenobacter busanensis]